MAYFLFIDESGQDGRHSPYEVLAGVAVADRDLWNLVCALREAEVRHFGRRYTDGDGNELKAKKILKSKTFRLAAQMAPIRNPTSGARAAKRALDNGTGAGRLEITALSQAKLAYVAEALEICARFRCRAFASVVEPRAPRPERDHLRKDYAYLFERFFYFMEDIAPDEMGIVVFDESEKSQSHLLLGQMDDYFGRTAKGRFRAGSNRAGTVVRAFGFDDRGSTGGFGGLHRVVAGAVSAQHDLRRPAMNSLNWEKGSAICVT